MFREMPRFTFSVDPAHDPLPDGITLSDDGLLKGVPRVTGDYMYRSMSSIMRTI